MFLDEPPRTNIIESEFRTIGNKIPAISKDLRDTLFIMGRKRDWLSKYRREKGWMKLLPGDFKGFGNIPLAKKFIDIDDFWYREHRDKNSAYKYLRRRLENKGIIVMQSGVVGTDNRRRLDVNEFRGFLLYDDHAPLIFVNSRDSKAGKIFTLIHEYIHFLLEQDDVFIEKDDVETDINQLTAEFLIPAPHVFELWDHDRPASDQIDELSQLFHVSSLAMAIRLKYLNIIPQGVVNTIKKHTKTALETGGTGETGRGNYYHTNRSRLGDSFLRAVIQGAEAGDIAYTYAFDLLGGSAKLYDHFKQEFMGHDA
jgi:Zn-dependent peptidase ImmA (M78 family)